MDRVDPNGEFGYGGLIVVTVIAAAIVWYGIQIQKAAKKQAIMKLVRDEIKGTGRSSGTIVRNNVGEMKQGVIDVATQGYTLETGDVVIKYKCSHCCPK